MNEKHTKHKRRLTLQIVHMELALFFCLSDTTLLLQMLYLHPTWYISSEPNIYLGNEFSGKLNIYT